MNELSIDPHGPWRIYSPTIPVGAVALGTVRRALGDTGALIRFERTGLYAQCNCGILRSLNRNAVRRALGQP